MKQNIKIYWLLRVLHKNTQIPDRKSKLRRRGSQNYCLNWFKNLMRFQVRRSISNKDEFYQSYLETDETRYNELVVVVDYGMVSLKGNAEEQFM